MLLWSEDYPLNNSKNPTGLIPRTPSVLFVLKFACLRHQEILREKIKKHTNIRSQNHTPHEDLVDDLTD
jgi:hypothetical protein